MIDLNLKLFLLALTALWPFVYQQAASPSVYEMRAEHDPDGIGKFYMGREIAHVMGYQGAEWLERPERIEDCSLLRFRQLECPRPPHRS
jgi:hypothetical protein